MANKKGNNNNPGGGNGGHQGGGQAGSAHPAAAVSAAQPTNNLPSWLTSSGSGTGTPVPISGWLSPDYPGGYAGWLNDHPNAGHDSTPPSNDVYKAWLQQHVGSDGQLHLPPAGGTAAPSGNAAPTPTPAPSGNAAPAGNDAKTPQAGSQDGKGNQKGKDSTPPGMAPADGSNDIKPIPPAGTGSLHDSQSGKHPGFSSSGVARRSTISQPPAGSPDQASHGAIAAPGASASSNAPSSSYTVQHGDTLSGIAAKEGMSLARLESLNPQIKDPNLILTGQTIHTSAPEPSGGITATTSSVAVGPNSGFPTSSSYPPTDNKTAIGEAKNLVTKIKGGWGSGPGNDAADPAKATIAVADHRDTNPLNIKDKGKARLIISKPE